VPLLEQRDGYFTKLKAATEGTHKLHKQKVYLLICCMLTHVMSIDGLAVYRLPYSALN